MRLRVDFLGVRLFELWTGVDVTEDPPQVQDSHAVSNTAVGFSANDESNRA